MSPHVSHAMGGPVQLYHRVPEAYEFEAKNSRVCLEEPTGEGFSCDDWPDDDPAADLFGVYTRAGSSLMAIQTRDFAPLVFGVRTLTKPPPPFLSPCALHSRWIYQILFVTLRYDFVLLHVQASVLVGRGIVV